jgi:hypothetical protein
MVFDDRHQILMDMHLISQDIGIEYDTSFLWAETAVFMSNDRYLAFGESCGSGQTALGFRQIVPGDDDDNSFWYGLNMEITYMDDSVVLPPYEKHSYDRYGRCTHTIRNGKLIKKIVVDERHQLLLNMPRILREWEPPLILEVRPISFVLFSNGAQLMYTAHPEWGTLGYMFISNTIVDKWQGRQREWKRLDITKNNPPYEKHSYNRYGHAVT